MDAKTPTPDVEEVIAFLSAFHEERSDQRWHLTSINKQGTVTEIKNGRTFFPGPDREAKVAAWVTKEQAELNDVYFAVNPLKFDVVLGQTLRPNRHGKLIPMLKANKNDVAEVTHLYVDCDVPKLPGVSIGHTLKHIHLKLKNYSPPPTLETFSGTGLWGFWELDHPVTVDGKDGPLTAAIEGRSIGIEQTIGKAWADNCHNIDRIARLPGTINWKGRTLAGKVSYDPTRRYSPDLFPSATKQQQQRHDVGTIDAPEVDALPTYDISDLGLDEETIKQICQQPAEGIDKSSLLYGLVCRMVRAGVPDKVILAVMMDEARPGFWGHVQKHGDRPARYAFCKRQLKQVIEDIGRPGPLLSVKDHYRRARTWIETENPDIKRYRDDFYVFVNGSYSRIDDLDIRAEISRWLEKCRRRREDKLPKSNILSMLMGEKVKSTVVFVPFQPDTNLVNQTLDAVKQVHTLPTSAEVPWWLDGRKGPEPTDLIAFPNCVLNVRTKQRFDPDPLLFSVGSLAFDYGDRIPTLHWDQFLLEIFDGGNNEERQSQIDTLHEMMGYSLSSDTSLQKAFALIGPPRSGKGTIGDMQASLLASSLLAGPPLRDLKGTFGLSALIGKRLAIIDDVRLEGINRGDVSTMVENILKISGNGFFTVDRKFKSPWEGKINPKLWMIANELPTFGDTSGAISSRFIILQTMQSFYDREDPTLFKDKLFPERLGVLHRALDGLERLRKRGHFAEPEPSKEHRRTMSNTGSNIKAFVFECCELDPDAYVLKSTFAQAYNSWLKDLEQPTMIEDAAAKQLYAAEPKVRAGKASAAEGRVPVFKGIKIRECKIEHSY
jgi:P4 family phage/plasmid primase-like protien